jgi:hypothetical protein
MKEGDELFGMISILIKTLINGMMSFRFVKL